MKAQTQMKQTKPITKPEVKKPANQALPFPEVMRRIIRVTPQEVKLPKR
jgi:hypothetical protein